MNKKRRNSSVELLRILSMLTIVGVHYFGCCDTENKLLQGGSLSFETFLMVKLLFSYGVNIFVIITGYYMVGRWEVNIRKAFDLLWWIAFYGIIMFGISIAIGINSFTVAGMVKTLFPILWNMRWFVKAYIILFLLVPYINVMLDNINKRQHEIIIAVLLILFSLWPFLLPCPPMDDYGFSYNHFIVLYIISAYLRKYVTTVNTKICICLFLTSTLLLFAIMHVDQSLPIMGTMKTMAIAHNSPLKLVACFSLFLLFANREWYHKTVNTLAASAFAVYVIHGDFNTMEYMFTILLKGNACQYGWMWLPHLLSVLVTVYLVCFAIDYAVKKSIGKVFSQLFDKIRILNCRISTKQ